jgi:hypothetical protein
LFEDVVDLNVEGVKGNKKAKGRNLKAYETSRPAIVNDDGDTKDEGLDFPNSDGEEEDRLRFKSWSAEGMKNPEFFVAQVFPFVVELRKANAEYSVKNRVEIKLPRNDNRRLRGHCAEE